MGLEIRATFEPLRTLAFGSISVTYAGIGTALAHPSRMMIVQNFTDVLITYSLDGINDHFVLPSNGQVIFDWTSNVTVSQGFFIAEGVRLYAKGAPTLGAVYVSTIYGTM